MAENGEAGLTKFLFHRAASDDEAVLVFRGAAGGPPGEDEAEGEADELMAPPPQDGAGRIEART